MPGRRVLLIREYYARIDAQDTSWVLALFTRDATYERAGVVYHGETAIRDFFCLQRQIRGIHSIEHLWSVDDDIVFAVGRFEGVGAAGDPRCIRFADVWWLSAAEHVFRRETFLATGHQYVES